MISIVESLWAFEQVTGSATAPSAHAAGCLDQFVFSMEGSGQLLSK
jgi:hypothetical protein